MSLTVKLLLSPLLVTQAVRTRRRAPALPVAAGPRSGQVGEVGQKPALRLLIVGDSSAAGVGVPTQDLALAGQLTRTLAQQAAVAVHWQLVALQRLGHRSSSAGGVPPTPPGSHCSPAPMKPSPQTGGHVQAFSDDGGSHAPGHAALDVPSHCSPNSMVLLPQVR